MKDQDMQRQPSRRPSSVLACVLAAAGIVLAAAACSRITPLGPAPGPKHSRSTAVPVGLPVRVPESPVYKLGSPIILQVMRSQSPSAAGGCPAGLVEVFLPPGAAALPCFQPVGTPVTITSASVSAVATYKPAPAQGQSAQPDSYGFMVGVPAAQVAAVTSLITQAYNSRGALGVSVAGRLWEAPRVAEPFPGQQLQIALLSRNQAVQLYSLLVPPS